MSTRLSTMILQEASKADREIMDDIERDQLRADYQNTLAGLETIGSISFTADSVPIAKDECGGTECGGSECGDACNETYMIEYDMLYKFTESNNYRDEVEGYDALCEYYNNRNVDLSKDNFIVVAECDEVNKGLLNNGIKSGNLGIARRYCGGICNLINHGIRVVKKG